MPVRQPPDMGKAGIQIAAAGADALDAIDALSRRAFDPRFGEAWSKAQCLSVLAMPGYRLRGAWLEQEGSEGQGRRLAGFAIIRSVGDESELLLLAVDPSARRQGVATALLQDWMNSAVEAGVVRVFLEMRTDNEARALYEAHDFFEVAVRPRYYRGNDGVMRDAVTMQRRLDNLTV